MYVMFWMQISQKMIEYFHYFNWIDVNNNAKIVDKQTWGIIYLNHTTQRTILITKQQGPSRMTDNVEQRNEKERERERPIFVIVPIIICVCDENYVRLYVRT